MPATTMFESNRTLFNFEGMHAELASPDEIANGIRVARQVFAGNLADIRGHGCGSSYGGEARSLIPS